jgi:preprotein translocase subunit Sec61beta
LFQWVSVNDSDRAAVRVGVVSFFESEEQQ